AHLFSFLANRRSLRDLSLHGGQCPPYAYSFTVKRTSPYSRVWCSGTAASGPVGWPSRAAFRACSLPPRSKSTTRLSPSRVRMWHTSEGPSTHVSLNITTALTSCGRRQRSLITSTAVSLLALGL